VQIEDRGAAGSPSIAKNPITKYLQHTPRLPTTVGLK